MIHDVQKGGIPWKDHTDGTHGLIAYHWLDRFELKQPEKDEIRNCVRYHMGRFVKPEEEMEHALNPTQNEHIVQLTDYFCSRKCASFLPGYDVPKGIINDY